MIWACLKILNTHDTLSYKIKLKTVKSYRSHLSIILIYYFVMCFILWFGALLFPYPCLHHHKWTSQDIFALSVILYQTEWFFPATLHTIFPTGNRITIVERHSSRMYICFSIYLGEPSCILNGLLILTGGQEQTWQQELSL